MNKKLLLFFAVFNLVSQKNQDEWAILHEDIAKTHPELKRHLNPLKARDITPEYRKIIAVEFKKFVDRNFQKLEHPVGFQAESELSALGFMVEDFGTLNSILDRHFESMSPSKRDRVARFYNDLQDRISSREPDILEFFDFLSTSVSDFVPKPKTTVVTRSPFMESMRPVGLSGGLKDLIARDYRPARTLDTKAVAPVRKPIGTTLDRYKTSTSLQENVLRQNPDNRYLHGGYEQDLRSGPIRASEIALASDGNIFDMAGRAYFEV